MRTVVRNSFARNTIQSERVRVQLRASQDYAEHFSESRKRRLRAYARLIGWQVDQAERCWRKAGRRRETLRGWRDEARELRDGTGRRSYY